MAGAVTGVDLVEGLRRVNLAGLDRAAVREIAAFGEAGLIKGAAKAAREAMEAAAGGR
jgi:hypothetical protein